MKVRTYKGFERVMKHLQKGAIKKHYTVEQLYDYLYSCGLDPEEYTGDHDYSAIEIVNADQFGGEAYITIYWDWSQYEDNWAKYTEDVDNRCDEVTQYTDTKVITEYDVEWYEI